MVRAKQWDFSSLWTYRPAFLIGLVGAPGQAQDQETPVKKPLAPRVEPPSVVLQAPRSVFQGQSVTLALQVQNKRGWPLDGVPVVFQVDPTWSWEVTLFPTQTTTRHGIAEVQFRADCLGIVDLTAQVGAVTKRAAIKVVPRHRSRIW